MMNMRTKIHEKNGRLNIERTELIGDIFQISFKNGWNRYDKETSKYAMKRIKRIEFQMSCLKLLERILYNIK